jgi:hypothetical protein
VRQSLRAPVDNSPILVRVVESTALAKGRRVHAVCLDISASGFRASWPGPAPLVGDLVEVAWDVADAQAESDGGWITARVVRIISRPFGARQIGLRFEIGDATQAASVRGWYQAWLHEHRRRLADDKSA